jgi:hypothetical protein
MEAWFDAKELVEDSSSPTTYPTPMGVSKMNGIDWRYVGHCVDGQPFLIEGVNVSDHEWRRTDEPHIQVEDPLYHQPCSLEVWELETNGRRIRFAAGEFSNCVWGFYRRPNGDA